MTNPKQPSQQLLQLYNEVDSYMRQQYKHDKYADHGFLIQELAASNRVIAKHQQEMRAVAQLRNSLVHNPFSGVSEPLAEPNIEVVNRYKAIRNALISPSTALTIAIPATKIYTAQPSSNLFEVLQAMSENIYTHVPIMEDNKMVGIFSEASLITYLAESGEAIITKDTKMSDFDKYLPLSAHKSESFIFLARTAPLSDVFDSFNKAIRRHERIGMLFITEHGKKHEKPLGIVTAWDLANLDLG